MCGRFTLAQDLRDFARKIGLDYDPSKFNPRFNICPSQSVYVVLNDGSDRITQARWGLVPSWSKDASIGARLANARSEDIEKKPSFRDSFKRKRCLVLADGYYEWQAQSGSKLKVAWYFRLTSKEVFGFAGLWDTWKDPSTELLTVCLITTAANSVVEPVHHRMPVIVQERFQKIWLSTEEQPIERLKLCLDAVPAAKMEKYAVSTLVNKPQNERPECIRPSGTEGCS